MASSGDGGSVVGEERKGKGELFFSLLFFNLNLFFRVATLTVGLSREWKNWDLSWTRVEILLVSFYS